jgi:hypothetical protein
LGDVGKEPGNPSLSLYPVASRCKTRSTTQASKKQKGKKTVASSNTTQKNKKHLCQKKQEKERQKHQKNARFLKWLLKFDTEQM